MAPKHNKDFESDSTSQISDPSPEYDPTLPSLNEPDLERPESDMDIAGLRKQILANAINLWPEVVEQGEYTKPSDNFHLAVTTKRMMKRDAEGNTAPISGYLAILAYVKRGVNGNTYQQLAIGRQNVDIGIALYNLVAALAREEANRPAWMQEIPKERLACHDTGNVYMGKLEF